MPFYSAWLFPSGICYQLFIMEVLCPTNGTKPWPEAIWGRHNIATAMFLPQTVQVVNIAVCIVNVLISTHPMALGVDIRIFVAITSLQPLHPMIHLLPMILSHGFTTLSTSVHYGLPFAAPAALPYIFIGGPTWNIALIFSIQNFDDGFLCRVGHALCIIFKFFKWWFDGRLRPGPFFPHQEIDFTTLSFGAVPPFLVVIFLSILSFWIPVMYL